MSMEIYIQNLNTNKGEWIDIPSLSDFDELEEEINAIAQGDDWEMTDTDTDTGLSSLIKTPADAFTVAYLMKEHIHPVAIKLVAGVQGGIDCTDMGDVKAFQEKCESVQSYESKDHFIEEVAENMGTEYLKRYFDEDQFLHDAKINQEFDPDTDDKDEFIEMALDGISNEDLVRYFDGESWFRDFDIELDGSWEEVSNGTGDSEFFLYEN